MAIPSLVALDQVTIAIPPVMSCNSRVIFFCSTAAYELAQAEVVKISKEGTLTIAVGSQQCTGLWRRPFANLHRWKPDFTLSYQKLEAQQLSRLVIGWRYVCSVLA